MREGVRGERRKGEERMGWAGGEVAMARHLSMYDWWKEGI